MIDRNPIIQRHLNEIEEGWHVVKPAGAGDIDVRCAVQKPSEYKEAYPNLPVRWFDDARDELIERELRLALSEAVVTK